MKKAASPLTREKPQAKTDKESIPQMTIKYNSKFPRWEVYGENPVIRAGEQQPCFVSSDYKKCETYIQRVEAMK